MAYVKGINMTDCMKNVTLEVKVTGMRQLRVRIWIATKILMLGAWVMGVGGIEIKTKDN